jgi:hypothetical protein
MLEQPSPNGVLIDGSTAYSMYAWGGANGTMALRLRRVRIDLWCSRVGSRSTIGRV